MDIVFFRHSNMIQIFKILKYTSQFKPWYILSLVLVLLVSTLSLASPFLSKQIVDLVVLNLQTNTAQNFNTLIILFAWIFAVDILVTILTSLNQYVGDILSSKLKTYLYKQFYQHVLSLDVEYFDNEMMGTKTIVISPAPHWRILDQYGGHLNIMKFRESFNNIDYECHGNTKPIPNFLPIGTLFEEKIKF